MTAKYLLISAHYNRPYSIVATYDNEVDAEKALEGVNEWVRKLESITDKEEYRMFYRTYPFKYYLGTTGYYIDKVIQ